MSHGGGTDGRFHLLRDSFRVGLPYPDVCRKRVVVHKADAEMNKLASCKRLNLDYVSESYGVFVAIFTAYNADSSLRIESLYDSSHVAPAFAIVPSLIISLSRQVGILAARLRSLPKNPAVSPAVSACAIAAD